MGSREPARFMAAAAVALVAAATAASARERPGEHYLITGDRRGDNLGMSLVSLDDLDGDGVRDFAAGAPQDQRDSLGDRPGYVRIISGASGSTLRTIRGRYHGQLFGTELAVVGDVDGDGVDDIVAAAERGEMAVISPVTGETLLDINAREDFDSDFFLASPRVVGPGDVDGDGVPDVAYGNSAFGNEDEEFNQGRISMYSGATGTALWHVLGEWKFSGTGSGLLGVRDVDGDGLPDLITFHRPASSDYGFIVIRRGVTGEVIGSIGEEARIPSFGARTASLGDLDGDGIDEIGAYGNSSGIDEGRGGVIVLRGSDFSVLHTFRGLDVRAEGLAGDVLGFRMSSAGDMDGDGTPDLLLGTFREGTLVVGGRRLYGRVYLRSGASGALLAAYEWSNGSYWFVTALAPLGDADGDGRPEFLVGSGLHPSGLSTPRNRSRRGEVRAITFDQSLPAFLRGDATLDGRVTVADAVAILRHLFIESGDPPCLEALNVDASIRLEVADAILLLLWFFARADAPSPPFPDCGRHGGITSPQNPCERSTCTP